MDIKEASQVLGKEAKELFYQKVLATIKSKRSFSKPHQLLAQYRRYLSNYNRVAQKQGIPFGILLYYEVINCNYSWENALNGNHLYTIKLATIRKILTEYEQYATQNQIWLIHLRNALTI